MNRTTIVDICSFFVIICLSISSKLMLYERGITLAFIATVLALILNIAYFCLRIFNRRNRESNNL